MTLCRSTLLGYMIIPAYFTPRCAGFLDSAQQLGKSSDVCLLQVSQGLGFEPLPVAAEPASGLPDNDLLTKQDEVRPPEPLYGFHIGTSAGLANVVNNGLLVGAFSEGGVSAHAKLLSDHATTLFYPSYDAMTADAPARVDIADVTAMSSDDSVVTVQVMRPIHRPGGHRSFSLLSGTKSGVSQFTYQCHGPGEAIVRIEVLLRDPRWLSPVIRLRKVCRAITLPGFGLGTAVLASSVVEDGSSKWTRERSPLIPFETTDLLLFATRTSPNLGNQSFEAPRVRVVAQSLGLDHSDLATPNLHPGSKVATGLTILEVSSGSPWARSGGTLAFGEAVQIALKFQCLYPGVALVELLLIPKPAWQPYKPLSVFMRKVCGGVHKHGLQVGSYKGGSDLVADGIPQRTLPKVDLLSHSSRFFVQYTSGDGDPQLEPSPRVRCDTGRAEPFGMASPVDAFLNVTSGMRNQQLTVTYTCKRGAVADCQLDLGLHFFKPLVLRWRKSCGGPRPDVVIESDLQSFSDVFSAGLAAPAWAKAEPAVELPGEQSIASFIIRSNSSAKPEDPEPLTLGRPIIEVTDPKVLDVALISSASLHGRVLRDSPDFVALAAEHVCKAPGEVVVHVKVPFLPRLSNGTSLLGAESDSLLQFNAAEFAYKKHCTPRHNYVEYALAFGCIVIFVIGFVGTTGFVLSKATQLNHNAGRRMAPAYGAADSQRNDHQQQQHQQNRMDAELSNTAEDT